MQPFTAQLYFIPAGQNLHAAVYESRSTGSFLWHRSFQTHVGETGSVTRGRPLALVTLFAVRGRRQYIPTQFALHCLLGENLTKKLVDKNFVAFFAFFFCVPILPIFPSCSLPLPFFLIFHLFCAPSHLPFRASPFVVIALLRSSVIALSVVCANYPFHNPVLSSFHSFTRFCSLILHLLPPTHRILLCVVFSLPPFLPPGPLYSPVSNAGITCAPTLESVLLLKYTHSLSNTPQLSC